MSISKIRRIATLIFSLFTVNAVADNLYVATSPVSLGQSWLFLGDSQTDGRARQVFAKSHALAFQHIWNGTFGARIRPAINGYSGRTLAQTHATYLEKMPQREVTWVHFQESGNQLSGGGTQDTPKKFAEQFEQMVRSVRQLSPQAIISTETAYSFEAEGEPGRNWEKYNQALLSVVEKLKAEGVNVFVAPVDSNIKKLIKAKRSRLGAEAGQQAVWGDTDNEIDRHYTGLGNFMIALSIYHTLGYDLNKLSLDAVPDAEIKPEDKALCLQLILNADALRH